MAGTSIPQRERGLRVVFLLNGEIMSRSGRF